MLSQIIDQAEGRKPSYGKRLAITLLLFGMATWVLASFLGHEGPGGLSASYPAVDKDPRLTAEARQALPIIAAIQKYRATHGGQVPPNLDLIRADLPVEKDRREEILLRFTYLPEGATHYRLQRQLGWDPSLIYEDTESGIRWIFDPGDGQPEKPIQLDL